MKLISSVEFFITRCVEDLEKKTNNSPYSVGILKTSKRYLKNFAAEDWRETKLGFSPLEIFNYLVYQQDDTLGALSLFILVSKRLSTISAYGIDYMMEISSCFVTIELPVGKYDAYLELFLNEDIYKLALKINNINFDECCFAILKNVPYEMVLAKDYSFAFKIFQNYQNSLNFLEENYSLSNITRILTQHARSKKEVQVIKFLEDIQSKNDEEVSSFLIESVQNIEVSTSTVDEFIRELFTFLYRYYTECFLGIRKLDKIEVCPSDELKREITQAITYIEHTRKSDGWVKMVITYAKRTLNAHEKMLALDKEYTTELLSYVNELDNDDKKDLLEKLVLFITVCNYRKRFEGKGIDNFLLFVAHAFTIYSVFPIYFDCYIDILTSHPLCDELSKLEEYKAFDCILGIISEVDVHDTPNRQMKIVYDELSFVTGKYHGLLFKGNYDAENIYTVLKSIMSKPIYALLFDCKDWQNLELLKRISSEMSKETFTIFAQRISVIESTQETNIAKAIKKILNYVHDYALSHGNKNFNMMPCKTVRIYPNK